MTDTVGKSVLQRASKRCLGQQYKMLFVLWTLLA